MYYTNSALTSIDYSDLAISFTGDISNGFISKVDGDGMKNAGIISGDYLLFTKDREPENGDIVYLEVYGQFMCRRIFFEPSPGKGPGSIRIRREDGITPDLVADERDVQIDGIFEGLIRKSGKRKSKIIRYLTPEQAGKIAGEEKEKTGNSAVLLNPDRPGGSDSSMSIHKMGFPTRLTNRLAEIGMRTAKDLLDIPDKDSLLAIPGLGKKYHERILEALEAYGFNVAHLYW